MFVESVLTAVELVASLWRFVDSILTAKKPDRRLQSVLEACRGSGSLFSLQQEFVGNLYRFLKCIFSMALRVEGL